MPAFKFQNCLTGIAACGLLALSQSAAADTTRHTLVPDDIYRMDIVGDPQVSPDGEWIAYVVTSNNRDADETRSVVWMVSWDGKQHRRLTDAGSSASEPRWSPDGSHLAYLATPAGAEHAQVMLIDRSGGAPRALTGASDDINSFAWSPDGQRLVLAVTTGAAKAPAPIVIDSMFFKEDVTGYIGRGDKQQLLLCDVASGTLTRLSDSRDVNDFLPAWSPDGRQIAFARTRERLEDTDGMMDIDVIEARPGATARTLVRAYAPNFPRVAWSPDGKFVAYVQGRELKYYIYLHDELALVPAAGGTPRALTAALDRAVMSYDFSADGKSVTLLVEDDGNQYPARLDLGSLAIERLIARPIAVTAQSHAGSHVAVVASDDTTASEIYALEDRNLRRLTTHGDSWLRDVQLGASEDFSFKSRDGTEVHGMLVLPPGYIAGRKYPAILWIHGGPDLQDDHSVDLDSYQNRRQMLAAAGYVVVGINYRGSSGRGFEFARAIFADWGHKEVEDLLAGMDTLVARGLIDPQRLGIGGLSYGGVLTDYAIASDPRFKAAVSLAGTGNILSSYGVDQYLLWYNAELGPPWKNPEVYLKLSYPFFHADRIHTPTLFMGGDRDFNVPITGCEQMYAALRTLGVPTQLVIYPDQFHELTRPSFYKDRLERELAWFDRYLKH
jgi:dipeptidyl aminopeptidase/acylaminoacyl peptidase